MMERHDKYPLFESRSAHHNVKVKHPARWRLFAELLLSPASRVNRYRDLSRRIVEDAIDNYDCRRQCR